MSNRSVYTDSVLRQRWDDTTRTYTEWDENGVQTLQRPYTDEENAAADAAAEAEQVAALELDQAAAVAALVPEQTNALLTAKAPPAGEPWRQPTGAHDAYPNEWQVTHGGKMWESTLTANVWEPGISGWREIGNDWPAWVQPAGGHDAYQIGAQVSHPDGGQHWISDIPDNVWEPGVYGWDLA